MMFLFGLISVLLSVNGQPDQPPGECPKSDSSPWTLNLIEFPKYPPQFCGGSLVKLDGRNESDIVIIAATCRMDGDTSFSVVAGANIVSDQFTPGIKVDADVVIIHPNYTLCQEKSESRCIKTRDPTTFEEYTPAANDLAIVKLKEPIRFNENIVSICISKNRVPVGTEGIIAGRGSYIFRSPLSQDLLLHSEALTVVDSNECKRTYGFSVQSTLICAKGRVLENTSMKLGDLGGAYVHKSGTDYVLLGVTTNVGYGCVENEFGDCGDRYWCGGVYTGLMHHVDWIGSRVNEVAGSTVSLCTLA